jgi:uncharacterized surface protein with fasciclin (FAS1) repeats
MRISIIMWGAVLSLGVFATGCGGDHRDAPHEQETTATTSGQALQNVNPASHVDTKDGGNADATGSEVGGNVMTPRKSIMENVTANRDITTFASLIRQVELVDFLNGTGPYTVFAPTNQAFEDMNNDQRQELLKPENRQQLQQLLQNHIVPGKLTAGNLQDGTILKTVGGRQLNVTRSGNQTLIDGAVVQEADAESSNGVIHLMTQVLVGTGN